ncbi:MAG TPA: amidohydrolase family protein [Allosphingosinicella sp.]|jgi:imidazolonepropionase-like amidohydrolase
MPIKSLLLAALGLLLAVAAPFEPAHQGTRIVYRHAALIDGTGAPLRPDMAVVTDGERIAAVLPDRALTPAQLAGAEQVDLTGRFLLPGLIDSHQHLATPPDRPAAEARLKRDIYSGVTAVRDMADDLRNVADLTRAARVGEMPSPDIYYAALMAGPSFFDDPRTHEAALGADAGHVPWMQAIDGRTDLVTAVTLARGTSATAVKIYANLPGPLVAAITREAHRQGMKVWAHGMVFPATPEEVVGAGVDSVSHVCYLAYQAMTKRPDSYRHRVPVDQALFEHDNPVMASLFVEMRRRGTILDATDRVYIEGEEAARKAGKIPQCTVALATRLTNQAWRAGVLISTGTDGETPPDAEWPAVFDEFELLGGPAGLPPDAVIRAATLTGAMALGQEKDMGSIEPGKLANLAILSKNPLQDVHNLRSIVLTVKRGRRFPRADYRPEPNHGG